MKSLSASCQCPSRGSRLIAALIVSILLASACGNAAPAQPPLPVQVTVTATAPGPKRTLSAATPAPTQTLPPVAPAASSTPAVPGATPVATAASADPGKPEPGALWRVGGDGVFAALGGLDADSARLYVAEAYQGILTFDLEGNGLGVISPGEIGYVVDVKVGPQGTLYMADRAFHQVSMFNQDGDPLGAFGGVGPGDGEFGSESPQALAVGPDGEVFVLDPNQDARGRDLTRVQVFSAEGDFLHSWVVAPEFDGQAMDVGPDGTVLVVSPAGYVAEFAPDRGVLIQRLGLESLHGVVPQAIGVDGAGNLYVTTQVPTAVAILDPLGQIVAWLGAEGVRTDEGWPEGEFLFPFGVAVTPDGSRVFVGDTYESFAYVTAFEWAGSPK